MFLDTLEDPFLGEESLSGVAGLTFDLTSKSPTYLRSPKFLMYKPILPPEIPRSRPDTSVVLELLPRPTYLLQSLDGLSHPSPWIRESPSVPPVGSGLGGGTVYVCGVDEIDPSRREVFPSVLVSSAWTPFCPLLTPVTGLEKPIVLTPSRQIVCKD